MQFIFILMAFRANILELFHIVINIAGLVIKS